MLVVLGPTPVMFEKTPVVSKVVKLSFGPLSVSKMFEPDWSATEQSYGAYPLFYYDEGCVEWVDEWDEVCGLES